MPTFHVTAIGPTDVWMPAIDAYLALAQALHEASDMCNANYVLPFSECGAREADIQEAWDLLTELHKDGWRLVRDAGDTAELGL